MTETLTGKQVLALLSNDEVPEIECGHPTIDDWCDFDPRIESVDWLLKTKQRFRIKPKPQRRLSATIEGGEVVSWPEPVREWLKDGQEYWYFDYDGEVMSSEWKCVREDRMRLAFGNVHLTREAAQEHADALRLINNQTGQSNA